MPAVTIRNRSEETRRASETRAHRHGRSTEAEMRDILETAVRPMHRVKLGTLLASIGREAGLTEADVEPLVGCRDRVPAEPTNFA